MTLIEDPRVTACTELSPGDQVEAWYGGLPCHRGPVTELAPEAGAFWIMDALSGGRKILDLENFHVVRVPLPPGAQALPATEAEAA